MRHKDNENITMDRKKFLKDIILEVGAFQKEHFGKVDDFQTKEWPHSLVSFVDKESEKMIADAIRQAFPEDEIMAEESYDADHNYMKTEGLWIIDPLDGTAPYLHNIPYYAIAIAFMRDGRTEMSSIYMPQFDELFFADESGAYMNDQPTSPTRSSKIDDSMLDLSPFWFKWFDIQKDFIDIFFEPRGTISLYTAACSLCYTASGRMDGGFLRNCGGPWDYIPGAYILQQAWGKVSKLDGSPWEPFVGNCLYSNGPLHEELVSLLN